MRPCDATGLMSDIRERSDAEARKRLVEIAILEAHAWSSDMLHPADALDAACYYRELAGMRNPSKGAWCAAGLTAAMDNAGLVVPEPGTSARRGAVALLDWQIAHGGAGGNHRDPGASADELLSWAQPGDIIAWLQHPLGKDPAGWRRGHVATIVKVDDDSITTVGWNEGKAPGRVMMRRLWRDPHDRDVIIEADMTVLWHRPGGLYGVARPVAK